MIPSIAMAPSKGCGMRGPWERRWKRLLVARNNWGPGIKKLLSHASTPGAGRTSEKKVDQRLIIGGPARKKGRAFSDERRLQTDRGGLLEKGLTCTTAGKQLLRVER